MEKNNEKSSFSDDDDNDDERIPSDGFMNNGYDDLESMSVREMMNASKNRYTNLRCESLFLNVVYVMLQSSRGPRTYLLTNFEDTEMKYYFVVQRIETKLSERRKGYSNKFLEELESQATKDGYGVYIQCVNSKKLKNLLEKRNYRKTKCGGYVYCDGS